MGRRAVARREMIWNMLQGADAVSLAVKRRANSQGTQRGGLVRCSLSRDIGVYVGCWVLANVRSSYSRFRFLCNVSVPT
jgi:hypothetical protein